MTEELSAPKQARAVAAPARPGRAPLAVAIVSLVLSGGALGAAGYLWWLQQQAAQAQKVQVEQVDGVLYGVRSKLDQLAGSSGEQANAQKNHAQQLSELHGRSEQLKQKIDTIDQRINVVVDGTARIDWMLSEVVHLVSVAERRLSLLGDVRGGLALLESAEKVVAAMEEPRARALRQALIDDINALRSASDRVIDTEGLMLRVNSTKNAVTALHPPRPNFRVEPVTVSEETKAGMTGAELFWHKVGSFASSLVRFEKHKDLNLNVGVDPQERFHLQQSIILLLDQAQLAILRGEATVYQLALREATDRVRNYMRVDTDEGKRVLRELDELLAQPVRQDVPQIGASLLALNAFREAWDKDRGARDAAAERVKALATDAATTEKSVGGAQ